MILLFDKEINRKPTFFREKITKGIYPVFLEPENQKILDYAQDFDKNVYLTCAPKIHTIRRNSERQYRRGVLLEMVFNEGFEKLIDINCASTQRIFMTYFQGRFEVSVDDKYMYYYELEKLAFNDGFESFEDFRDYFMNKMDDEGCYSGSIIHWTDLKY